MTSGPRAARQALRLCECELVAPASRRAAQPQPPDQVRPRMRTAKAALVAVGLPQHTAAALRRRLQLTPEQETTP